MEAVPTVKTVTRVHLYVFTWRDEKFGGPIWMNDRAGEGWGERNWGQVHPASQELLDEALKAIAAQSEQAERMRADRMATVNALHAQIHELAQKAGLPASEEPGCANKISKRVGADKDMLARIEQRDFRDASHLFEEICKQ